MSTAPVDLPARTTATLKPEFTACQQFQAVVEYDWAERNEVSDSSMRAEMCGQLNAALAKVHQHLQVVDEFELDQEQMMPAQALAMRTHPTTSISIQSRAFIFDEAAISDIETP